MENFEIMSYQLQKKNKKEFLGSFKYLRKPIENPFLWSY